METKFTHTFTVFPEHTNYMPPMIFGGKLLAEMDICAAMTVRRFLYSSRTAKDAVTVAVNNVSFYVGAVIGDLIFLEGEIVHTGNSAVDVHVTGWRESHLDIGELADADLTSPPKREKICDGDFRFCTSTPPTLARVRRQPHGLKIESEPKNANLFLKKHEN
jgi:acyl-coenzyme A thioesterase PaaI-like protein